MVLVSYVVHLFFGKVDLYEYLACVNLRMYIHLRHNLMNEFTSIRVEISRLD